MRTVSGDVGPAELGRVDVHEHMLMATPALPGEEMTDVEAATAEARLVREAGIDTLVELTTLGLGRDPEGLRTVSEASGLRIVMATGVQHDGHHPPGDPIRAWSQEALVDRMTADIETGTAGVRCGMLKVGTGYWSITPFDRRNLEAAAEVHRRTGAPITCHLELGTAALEVVAFFVERGVAADRLILAHIDRNPDPGLHLELASAGAYLSYDGWTRTRHYPDSLLLDCLVSVAESGGAERILLGSDTARASSLRSQGGLPGMDYMPRRVVPRLDGLGGYSLVETILVANPARVLTLS